MLKIFAKVMNQMKKIPVFPNFGNKFGFFKLDQFQFSEKQSIIGKLFIGSKIYQRREIFFIYSVTYFNIWNIFCDLDYYFYGRKCLQYIIINLVFFSFFFSSLKKNSEKYFGSGKISNFSFNEKKISITNIVFPSDVDTRSFFPPTNYNNIFTEAIGNLGRYYKANFFVFW